MIINPKVRPARPGDIVVCKGIHAEIAKIAYQEYLLSDRNDGTYDWSIEFMDTKGNYRSWKQYWDGGEIILKDRYTIKIYQAPVWEPFCFRGWKHAEEYAKDSLKSHYRCVYKGTIDTNDLNKIWAIFNINHPEGYKARSLSVSDIVVISNGTSANEERYFVDSVGFHRLNDDEFPM